MQIHRWVVLGFRANGLFQLLMQVLRWAALEQELYFSFWCKSIVGLLSALEQEQTKQEFLSVPTHAAVEYQCIPAVHQMVYIYSAPE